MEKKYDIYLSYSRQDGYKARLLKSALDGRGYRTFFDFKGGIFACDFEEYILGSIKNSSVFIFLYPSDGVLRDWMRKEVSCAIENNKHIIPIVFDRNIPYIQPSDSTLDFISRYQHVEINLGEYFDQSIDRLVERLNYALSDIGIVKVDSDQIIRVTSDRSCRVYRLEEIGVAYKDISTPIQVPEGDHKLMFVDLERESVRVEKNVSMNGVSQEVDIKLLDKYKKSTNSDEIDVFISYNSDDLDYAKEIAEMCRSAGKSYFLSAENLKKMGKSAYMKAIAEALDKSRHLVVVCMTQESLQSEWVELEYNTFLNEICSGRKDGNMITIVNDGISVNDLPIWLRGHEVIPYKQKENAVEYFK